MIIDLEKYRQRSASQRLVRTEKALKDLIKTQRLLYEHPFPKKKVDCFSMQEEDSLLVIELLTILDTLRGDHET